MEQLDRIFAARGRRLLLLALRQSHQRRARRTDAPRSKAAHGALACASGMAALHIALLGRADGPAEAHPRRERACTAPPISLLMNVLEPLGVEVAFRRYLRSRRAVEQAAAEHKPGCILMETISNPLLRVGAIDRIAEIARAARRGAGRRQHLRHAAAGAAARTRRATVASTASPSTWRATATCWAAWSSPIRRMHADRARSLRHASVRCWGRSKAT